MNYEQSGFVTITPSGEIHIVNNINEIICLIVLWHIKEHTDIKYLLYVKNKELLQIYMFNNQFYICVIVVVQLGQQERSWVQIPPIMFWQDIHVNAVFC